MTGPATAVSNRPNWIRTRFLAVGGGVSRSAGAGEGKGRSAVMAAQCSAAGRPGAMGDRLTGCWCRDPGSRRTGGDGERGRGRGSLRPADRPSVRGWKGGG